MTRMSSIGGLVPPSQRAETDISWNGKVRQDLSWLCPCLPGIKNLAAQPHSQRST